MDKLGIEPSLLAAQVVNFLVIIVILQKLLYKPILQMLEKRRKAIAEGVELTEKMQLENEALRVKQEKALAKAREDALAIIEDAKKQAKEVEKELVADAHAQVAALLTRAKAESEELHHAAAATIRTEAVELAVIMAKRLLGQVLGVKEQHALIERRVKDLAAWAKAEDKKSDKENRV